MAIGDEDDIAARLQLLTPNGWFTVGLSAIRDAALQGAASALSFAYALLAYVQLQTRIATASDGWLDLIAGDFFGPALMREEGQSDDNYRAKIQANMFRERGTRAAVTSVLTQLTGRPPVIFEPARPADTGAYGLPMMGYGVAGAYGSLSLPFQSFVTAHREPLNAPSSVAGYGVSTGAYSQPSREVYVDAISVRGAVTDSDILAAIDSVRPAGYVIWAQITN